jgi:hypothetical protein
MAPTLTVDSYAHLETPPPKWGDVCEARWGDQLEQAIEGKTPTEAGRCLRDRHQQGRRLARETPTEAGRWLRGFGLGRLMGGSSEKPPPKRGGGCEWLDRWVEYKDMEKEKPPPKWVHRHLPQIVKVPATTIAHNQPNGASQSKTPGEGQGWQVVWLGVQAFNSLIQEVNSRFVRVRTKPSLL